MLAHSILLFISIGLPVLAWMFFPVITKEIFRDIRFARILHYVALAGLGFALYFKDHDIFIFLVADKILIFPLFTVALIYAAVFAIVTNNIADIEIGKPISVENIVVHLMSKDDIYNLTTRKFIGRTITIRTDN